MSTGRATFTGRMADLDFTMKVAAGFVEAVLPTEEHDFDQPHVCAPLLLLSSPVARAAITVAARPGFASGTVRDWLVFLCQHNGIRLLSIGPAYVGGLHKNHPAIIATALQEQNGTELVMSLVAMEDGGRFVTAHAMCPRELEPSYMKKMEASLFSIELLRHKGPTVNLEDNGAKFEIEIIAPEPPRLRRTKSRRSHGNWPRSVRRRSSGRGRSSRRTGSTRRRWRCCGRMTTGRGVRRSRGCLLRHCASR